MENDFWPNISEDFWPENYHKPMRFFYFGDFEKARALVGTAKEILVQLKLMQMNDPFINWLNKPLPDGSFIQVDSSVPGMDIIKITAPPPPKPMPRREYVEENIYIVYDLVQDDKWPPEYTGEHLTGFQIIPLPMDKNGPNERTTDWVLQNYDTPDGPLEPQDIREFDEEFLNESNWHEFNYDQSGTNIQLGPNPPGTPGGNLYALVDTKYKISVSGNELVQTESKGLMEQPGITQEDYSPEIYPIPGHPDPYEGTFTIFIPKTWQYSTGHLPTWQSGQVLNPITNPVFPPTDNGGGKASKGDLGVGPTGLMEDRWMAAFQNENGSFMMAYQQYNYDSSGSIQYLITFDDGNTEVIETEQNPGMGSLSLLSCKIYKDGVYLLSYSYGETDPESGDWVFLKIVYCAWIKQKDKTRKKFYLEFNIDPAGSYANALIPVSSNQAIEIPYYTHQITDTKGNKYSANGNFRVVLERRTVDESQLVG
jgi:hypothetical protein